MYEMHKRGATYKYIAKELNVSESTAYKGVKRMKERLMRRFAMDSAAEARLDLDRIDDMIRSFYPMTKPQKIEIDGKEEVIPPSIDAAKLVMQFIEKRSKIFGYDSGEVLTVQVQNGAAGPAIGPGSEEPVEVTPAHEVMKLLEVFEESGIMEPEVLRAVRELLPGDDVVDAEVVEDEVAEGEVETFEDPTTRVDVSDEPPELVDDYDDEFPDTTWRPEE